LGTPNPCQSCHADRSAEWARDRVREWYGRDPSGSQAYARALYAGRTGAVDATTLLGRLIEDTGQPGIARATALGLLRNAPGPALLRRLERGWRDEAPLVRRAAVEAPGALPPPDRVARAGPLLDDPLRAVRIAAARQLAAVPPDALDAALRPRFERALAEYVA